MICSLRHLLRLSSGIQMAVIIQRGIAYKDEIICGCCGGVFEIEEIIEDAKNDGVVPIIPYELWVDLVSEIAGDDL